MVLQRSNFIFKLNKFNSKSYTKILYDLPG
jgi:hypothetical protein